MITHFRGLHASAKALILSEIAQQHKRLVVLCADRRSAEELTQDLKFFLDQRKVLMFGDWDTLALEPLSPQLDVTAERLAALFALDRIDSFALITHVSAVTQRIIPKSILQAIRFELRRGESVERACLLAPLSSAGYQPVSLVEDWGEFAARGNVIDFFPAHLAKAVRVELRADCVHALRLFDPESQRSLTELEQLSVYPVAERVDFATHPSLAPQINDFLERLKARTVELHLPLPEQRRLNEIVRSGVSYPGVELVQYACFDRLDEFSAFLPPDTTLVVDTPMAVEQQADLLSELLQERTDALRVDQLYFPDPAKLFVTPQELQTWVTAQATFYLDGIATVPESERQVSFSAISNLELSTSLRSKVGSGKALQPLSKAIEKWRSDDLRLCVVVGSPGRAERLQKSLLDLNIDARILDMNFAAWLGASNPYPCVIAIGQLSAGFQLPERNLVLIAESEIFGERSSRRRAVKGVNLKRLMNSIGQLKQDDFIVHIDYGVGIYRGLRHLKVDSAFSDLLQIDYADSKLFLPIQNISRIQKFVAAEGKAPTLDKLSSGRWKETKRKVRASVATLAGELIKLYAARKVVKGWRFDPYGAEDERFADTFAYDETPDQLKAIEDTLADMCKDRPMDRIICGDVGFGKTEVALRAAFKCAQHAKQVALLAPTTLLVEQHKQVFQNRMRDFPLKIAALSRFYSSADNKQTIEQLGKGDIDIVIGTQRLLQRDVGFADLGLVIVDEEHRFGVKQKERLKQLKKQVDVLTLTATPIPRSLHMSLIGIRDISVISTPPHDRRLVRTYVATHEERIVRDAITRELQRRGQVFYVNNRIENIEMVTAHLRELVPEARFAFAHGQMPELILERIMTQFLKQQIDVLVSTTIIESGLDIPNANTILIDRADAFGLAQLYQLRGRVGRSERQAYAYFLIPKSQKISLEAQERLKALQALDDLGQGFNLAVRDLEIRGAGNLLGKEQSGNVLLVGLDLYNRILKEAVLNLKGEEIDLDEVVDPEVKIGFDAFIPQEYIPDVSERLVLYQRLAMLSAPDDIQLLIDEFIDRFGPPPKEVGNLFELMRLRALLRHYGVEKAEVGTDKIQLAFNAKAKIDGQKLLRLISSDKHTYRLSKGNLLTVRLESALVEPTEIYLSIESLLGRLAA